MALSTRSGFNNLLKEGHRHYSGLEEAILKNIEACKEISNMTRTSLGPNGMKKMVINYLDKIFVTSDAATIMKELEVQHPAAKMVVMAARMQENECGDNTNFVITFAGELLEQAENLIKQGLHTSQIIMGYEAATKKAVQFLESFTSYSIKDIKNQDEVAFCLKSCLSSKLFGYADLFSKLIADACIKALPQNALNFDIEYIRVAKILGGSLNDCSVLKGLIITRDAEGAIKHAQKPRVAVYSCPLDTQTAETKGTVLLKSAKELLNYTKTEEDHAENIIKEIANAKINVVIVGGSISDIILHYLEKYKIMCIKVNSKFELRRICKALQATPLVRLGAPTEEEVGFADEINVEEIGSQKVCVIKRETTDCKLSTIVLRGSTNNLLDDIERAIDDGVNVYKAMLKDPRFVPGAGASEIMLALKLEQEGNQMKGLEQYSFNKFANSFECIPKILAENAGMNTYDFISKLYSANQKKPSGLDIVNQTVEDMETLKVIDHLQNKIWAIKFASDAAITILRVDQIIIAKPAGGPKPKQNTNWDED